MKDKRIPDLPALTGIRFFAASLVFFGHVSKIPGMDWLLNVYFFHLGAFGVAVFFVLSGFILTYNYARVFEAGVNAADYGRFLWDRLSKVYPLYLFTLLLCIPIQMAGQHRDWNWQALTLHLTLSQCIFPFQHLKLTDYFNVPGWSISCEMLFYLLAPMLIWVGLRFKRWPHLILTAVILWPLGLFLFGKPATDFIWPSRFALLRFPEFCLGIATAVCFIRFPVVGRRSWIFVSAGLLLLFAAFSCEDVIPYFLARGPLAAPGAALLIYGLASGQGLVARLLSNRWIVLLGGASFAFYLIHDPFIRICKGVCQLYHLTVTGSWTAMAVVVTMFVVVQALSILVFKTVELPIQKRLRAVIRRKVPAAQPASAVAAVPASIEPTRGPSSA